MLTPVDDGPAIVVCSTCRDPAADRNDSEPASGGARLIAALRAIKASDPTYAGVAVQEMACLFACAAPCAVHLRGAGRIGYALAGFAPDTQAARAILDYAAHYAASAEGEVPYRDWPEGVKGHFLARTPPAGFIAT